MQDANNIGFSRLSYYSLIGLALLPLLHPLDLNFWEVLRVLAITVGLVCLRLRRGFLASEASWEIFELLLLSLVYMFILIQFEGPGSGVLWTRTLGGVLAGIAFFGICASRSSFFTFTFFDRTILITLAVVFLLKVSTQLVFIVEGPHWLSLRWGWALQIVALLLIYFVISRIARLQNTGGAGRRLLSVAICAFGVVSLVGVWRTSEAFYLSTWAVRSFQEGRYDQARDYTSRLIQVNTVLNFPPSRPERVIAQMIDLAENVGHYKGYMAAGTIAEEYYLWDLALRAYRGAVKSTPHSPIARASLGNSLLETGLQEEALRIYRKALEEPGPEDHVGLGLVLARMGRWVQANDVLSRAIDLDDAIAKCESALSEGNGIASVELQHLLSESLVFYLERLTLFEVVKLLEGRGWRVFHLPMEIGSSGVCVPVTISAVSGAGASFAEESIRIGGDEFSPQKRGYNVVVINAESGRVEGTANFDTWDYVSNAHRLASYIRAIPKGKIVVATVNDEGSKELTDLAKAELRTIGANRLPQKWGSHAVIGVKGAPAGSVVEKIAERNKKVHVGVMTGNVDPDVVANPDLLKNILLQGALDAPAGIALFIPRLRLDARVTLARRR